MSANDKTGVGAGNGEWQTPPEFYAWVRRRFATNFDLFASEANALEPFFATDHGVFREGEQVAAVRTGLDCDVGGLRPFANPPYTNGFIAPAVDSMIARRHEADGIVALLPASTDTGWFKRLWAVSHIEFLDRRVRFIHPMQHCINRKGELCTHEFGKPGDSPPGGHLLAIFRQDMPTWRGVTL